MRPMLVTVEGRLGGDTPSKWVNNYEVFDAAFERLMFVMDTSIKHGDVDMLPPGGLPQLGNIELFQAPRQSVFFFLLA